LYGNSCALHFTPVAYTQSCFCCLTLTSLLLQPIKVQTLPGKAESAIMHVVDMEASNADKRFTAMVRHTPLHTFLFNKHGKLLVANDAAMEACLHSTAGLKVPQGQDITLKALFDLGSYPGQS
jgi:predicted DCC family thiol-disulfide oxidoreductase YuxK